MWEKLSKKAGRRQMDEVEELKAKLAVYKKLVERYSQEISEGEQKTIPELKEMVVPKDASIREVRRKILSELGFADEPQKGEKERAAQSAGVELGGSHYRFEKDFLSAAEKAYNSAQSFKKVHHDLPVSFWLKPYEMLDLGVADAFDRAIFLCSLLRSVGCENAMVRVLDLEEGFKHPTVLFSYNEKQYLMDPMQECTAFTYHGKLEEIFKNYTYESKKALKSAYEFNDKEYLEFE